MLIVSWPVAGLKLALTPKIVKLFTANAVTVYAPSTEAAMVRLTEGYRGPNEPPDNPCWDSHTQETERLRTVLVPPMVKAFAALLEDLSQRGLLGETLVVCLAEFGRTPRINNRGGRDHWGSVFSVALAGGGVRGGVVHGASDPLGAQPGEGRVQPQDLTATILHCLGIDPDSQIHDRLGRPVAACTGAVIRQVF